MKTKEEILKSTVDKLQFSYQTKLHIYNLLIKELPDFNPYKIDEDRMEELYESTYNKDWDCSTVRLMSQKYNSTAKEGLKPLPDEMPDDLSEKFENNVDYFVDNLWKDIYDRYGTPPRQELPSVEKLGNEIASIYVPIGDKRKLSRLIAQHLVNKYKLPTQTRDEFPFNLKRGDKFMRDTEVLTFTELSIALVDNRGRMFNESYCTPYVEPVMTAESVIKAHNLSDAEVKAIREGGDMK